MRYLWSMTHVQAALFKEEILAPANVVSFAPDIILRRNPEPMRYLWSMTHVQAALFILGVFPPPASGADIFTRRDRAGARRATQAGVELVVQLVVGYIVLADVRPHVLVRPIQQRVQLLQTVVRIVSRDFQRSARHRLIAAHAGDPRSLACQRAAQRFHLAHKAATLAILHAVVEPVDAVLRDISLDQRAVREVHL